jgi:hypothetical protein
MLGKRAYFDFMFVGTGAGGAENATIEDKNSRKQSFVF